jgi:hypothetical protein
LYLHGDTRKALDAYMRLVEIYALNGMDAEIEATQPAISGLAERLGLSREQVKGALETARARGVSIR